MQIKMNSKRKKKDLKNAVTIASIAEILKAKVTFSFRKLVTQSFLEFRTCCTHLSSFLNLLPQREFDKWVLGFLGVLWAAIYKEWWKKTESEEVKKWGLFFRWRRVMKKQIK